jgi:hypothetical protein
VPAAAVVVRPVAEQRLQLRLHQPLPVLRVQRHVQHGGRHGGRRCCGGKGGGAARCGRGTGERVVGERWYILLFAAAPTCGASARRAVWFQTGGGHVRRELPRTRDARPNRRVGSHRGGSACKCAIGSEVVWRQTGYDAHTNTNFFKFYTGHGAIGRARGRADGDSPFI